MMLMLEILINIWQFVSINEDLQKKYEFFLLAYSKNDNAVNKKFTIPNPGFCTLENQYGFAYGRPCVLVKMNKVRKYTRNQKMN
jgi:hypothetical protein